MIMNWKNFLRMSTFAVVALSVFAACSDSDDDPAPAPAPADVVADAKLATFGFYKEDNPEYLTRDYVATVPEVVAGTTSYKVEIPMPSTVMKSMLVARFTVNEGNTVTVGNDRQSSGVTVNDFSADIEYFVKNLDNTQTLRYTISVVKATNMAWTESSALDVATLTGNAEFTGVYSGAVLKVSPKDNLPYVAFGARGVDNKLTVAKNVGGAWSLVGSPLFTSQVNGSHFDFDIAENGTPYVAYGDQDATSLKGALSVMKFDGSQWSNVGEQGFFKVQAQYVGLTTVDDKVFTGMINNSASGDTPRRTLSVANYEGGTWTTGESSLLPSGQGVYMVKMGNNITATLPVMISVNRGKVDNANYGHNVFYRDGGEWKALLTNYVQENATQTSIAAGSFGAISDLSGAIYVWTGDDADNTGNYQVRLRKYDQEARAWSTVGGNTLPIGHDGGFESHLSLDIAIAPDGTPFVAFNNFKDGKKLYVMYLDPDTRQWTAAQQLAEGADDVNIAFSSTGEGYITYTDGDNKIHIFKYAERQ